MSIIELRQLTRRYGRRVGVEELTLAVPEGAIVGFLGPNGSGKSTTIRVLLGFLRPTTGAASIFGLDCWKHSPRVKADVGYMPGDFRLYSWMSGNEALRIVGLARRRELAGPGRRLAEQFDLDLAVRVRRMSRGMRQKLGIILALVHEPRLLILDEPTSSLDPIMQARLDLHLRELAQRGHTVFFSSHTLSEVERLCDRVAILREGRLVSDETIDAMRRRAAREVVIRWRDGVLPPSTPPFLQLRERSDCQWSGTLAGPVPALVQWLAQQPVEDVTIGRPDLDSLFRDYYRQEETS